MAKRVDNNQADIIAELRSIGATVQDLHEIGKGCGDILVGFSGRNYLFEIKSPGGRLTQDEIEWRDKWRGNYYVIFNAEQAIEIITQDEW